MPMTAIKVKRSNAWYSALLEPVPLTIIAIVYTALAVLSLFAVPRSSPVYNLVSMVTLPAVVITPMIFISLPIRNLYKGIIIGVLLAVVMPVIGIYFPEYLDTVIQICIYACLALGLNVVVGYAGLLDLGYVAFFAVGAYLWGMFTSQARTIFFQNGWLVEATMFNFLAFVLLGAILAAGVGIILGLPVLRVRGDYLAIVTLGFGEIIRIIARNLDRPINYTNGALGLNNIAKPPSDWLVDPTSSIITFLNTTVRPLRIDKPENVANNLLIYALALLLLLIVIVISHRLENSPIGRAWTAIREDEVAAVAMGVPKLGMKLRAFSLGATFGGAIGVIFAAKNTFIDPNSFLLLASISILSMVIIGGMGGIKGVILGAIMVRLVELHILTNLSLQINSMKNNNVVIPIVNFDMGTLSPELDPTKFKPLMFGLILVCMMLFRPEGLLPATRRRLELEEARTEDNVAQGG